MCQDALKLNRPFAVVAKPCDINAVRHWATVLSCLVQRVVGDVVRSIRDTGFLTKRV